MKGQYILCRIAIQHPPTLTKILLGVCEILRCTYTRKAKRLCITCAKYVFTNLAIQFPNFIVIIGMI